MPHVTAALTDDLHARVKDHAEQYGVAYTEAVAYLLDAGLVAESLPKPLTAPLTGDAMTGAIPQFGHETPTLDEACAVILEHLRPEQAELIRVLEKEHGFTATNYILGYCKIAHERGETAGMYDERVRFDRDTPGGQAVVPDVATEATCEQCHAPFTPSRVKQRFCPDPDDGTVSCGRAWTLANQIHPTRPDRPGSPFAPPRSRPPSPADLNTARELAALKAQLAALTAKLEPAG